MDVDVDAAEAMAPREPGDAAPMDVEADAEAPCEPGDAALATQADGAPGGEPAPRESADSDLAALSQVSDGVEQVEVPAPRALEAEEPAEVGPAAEAGVSAARKRGRPPSSDLRPGKGPDIRSFFMAGRPSAGGGGSSTAVAMEVSPTPRQDPEPLAVRESGGIAGATPVAAAPVAASADFVLSAFNLRRSPWQELSEAHLEPRLEAVSDGELEVSETSRPATLAAAAEPVLLLVAKVPLLTSGRAIFGRLPSQWLELSGRSDSLGTRCLFASRRHEHSVFAPLAPDSLLRVPLALSEWQPQLSVAPSVSDSALLAEEAPWSVQMQAGRGTIRVLLRPGVLLHRMLRRGTALPASRFTWRVVDASAGAQGAPSATAAPRPGTAATLGDFSILTNLEDAAHTQPPRFREHPLRREQLRSLGWMVAQEKRRREPFATELRDEVSFPDAPHWRLQGSLRCEYTGVKGGVLADAIGYGKTACTIGLVDCTAREPAPQVPAAFAGFIPSRATLVLAPTNLHTQWLGEIKKFTGDSLRVLSIPTCAQLKRLTMRELMEADVVVATYRLFYSAPYLRRLAEVARTQRPDFAFPRLPGAQGSHGSTTGARQEWAQAYRAAFEAVPGWAARLPGHPKRDPVTPERSAAPRAHEGADDTPTPAQGAGTARRCRGKSAPAPEAEAEQAAGAGGAKRRRLTGKQLADPEETGACASAPVEEANSLYLPLEAFWWRRVVCDEFHELLSRYPPAQVAVELFHGDYKWGLSGTPPCQTLAQIRKAAGFLGVQLPTLPPAGAAPEDAYEAPRQVAQEWLDAFARRNTAELPPLEEEERIVAVRQTPKERALYMALAHHAQGLGSAAACAEVSLEGLEETPEMLAARQSASGLLKLCSHFCPSGASEVLTAEDECERQVALRREQVRAVEREAKNLAERAASTVQMVRHFEPHFCRAPSRADYGHIAREPRARVAARLKLLGAATTGTKAELLKQLLDPAGAAAAAPEELKDVALRVDFQAKAPVPRVASPPSWLMLEASAASTAVDGAGKQLVAKAVREALAAAGGGEGIRAPVPARCARLRSNLGMPKRPGASATPEAVQEFCEASWEWLSEQGNAEKLRGVTTAWKADLEPCAARLRELEVEAASKIDRLRSFQRTLSASQAQADAGLAAEPQAPDFAKYGSKIRALVGHVQQVHAEDPGCKIICFVQWEDLKRKISSALEEFGVEHLTLSGSVWARRAALVKFQYDAESPRMLLLSLEESASGTNLTAANHVIIVHPMEAASSEEAVAFEMQAIGRVRRPGQERKIHIWRFVTVGTIEQRITEEHQRELWERQRSTITVVAPEEEAAEASSAEELEEEPEAPEDPERLLESVLRDVGRGPDLSTQRYLPEPGGEAEAEARAHPASGPASGPGPGAGATQALDQGATQRYQPF